MYTPLSQRRQQKPSTGGYSSVDDIMERISSVESGGRYDALGPEVTSGMYAGERALGKYQIMPGNLPEWSKEALGREVTSDEFLANPEIQDAITRHQMQKNLEKYGNPDDVASVWFTGRPVDQAQGAKDVTGTDVNEYVRRFNSAGQPQKKGVYTRLSERSGIM